MENLISTMEDERGGEPRRIGDILAELMVRYEGRFPAVKIAIVPAASVMPSRGSQEIWNNKPSLIGRG